MTALKVYLGEYLIPNGSIIPIMLAQSKIHIQVPEMGNGYYTLMMFDPDAVTGEFLHDLKINLHIENGDTRGTALIKYTPPNPPPGKAHHYIIQWYAQTGKFTSAVPAQVPFDHAAWVSQHHLQLIAESIFITSV